MRWEKPTWIELDTDLGTVYVCSQDYVATKPDEETGTYIQQYRPPVTVEDVVTSGAKVRISRRRLSDGLVETVAFLALDASLWDDVMKNFEVAKQENRVAPKVRLRVEQRAVVEKAADSAPPQID